MSEEDQLVELVNKQAREIEALKILLNESQGNELFLWRLVGKSMLEQQKE